MFLPRQAAEAAKCVAELDVDKVGWFSENILNNILKKTYYKEVCRKYCSKYFQENKYKNQKILYVIPYRIFCKLEIADSAQTEYCTTFHCSCVRSSQA